MKKEFICMVETVVNTQKKIRQWVSQGYQIEIITQNLIVVDKDFGEYDLITSLWRWKETTYKDNEKEN